MGQRIGFINEFRSKLIQQVSVKDQMKRKPMNKNQFMAFLRFKEGVNGLDTQEQQDSHWAKVLANPNTTILEGTGDSAVILVDKGRVLLGVRERTLLAQVSHGENLESAQDLEQAMARMATTGAAHGALSSSVFGQAGALFQPSSAHSHWGNNALGSSGLLLGGRSPADVGQPGRPP